MAPGSRAGRPARRSIPARLLSSLQQAILSALMSSAAIILERRIRATLRRGDGTGRRPPPTGHQSLAQPITALTPRSHGRRLSGGGDGGVSKLQDSFERLMHGHAPPFESCPPGNPRRQTKARDRRPPAQVGTELDDRRPNRRLRSRCRQSAYSAIRCLPGLRATFPGQAVLRCPGGSGLRAFGGLLVRRGHW
jgi:hypothetical protein